MNVANVSRAAFLQTPGATVTRRDYIQTDSPTLSSHRTRWLELREWTTFPADFPAFWDSIPEDEKDQLMFTAHNLIFYL